MTNYYFDSKQHSNKIKAGMLKAKQAGKKLGRPKGGKIKGEDEVIDMYRMFHQYSSKRLFSYEEMAHFAKVSKSTVQTIINKYKRK